jgi:hypothetical protein
VPVFKVKPENDYPIAVDSAERRKKKRFPTVSIPVSPAIIAALEVGKPVVVELKGTVRGLESRQSADADPYMNRNELRVELRVVEAYPSEDDEEEADDAEQKEPSMKDAIDKGLGYGKAKAKK